MPQDRPRALQFPPWKLESPLPTCLPLQHLPEEANWEPPDTTKYPAGQPPTTSRRHNSCARNQCTPDIHDISRPGRTQRSIKTSDPRGPMGYTHSTAHAVVALRLSTHHLASGHELPPIGALLAETTWAHPSCCRVSSQHEVDHRPHNLSDPSPKEWEQLFLCHH